MVTRNSQETQYAAPGSTQVRQSGAGAAQADFAQGRAGHDFAAPINPDSSGQRLLGTIMGVVGKLGEQALTQSLEEAYLTGAAKAGTIKSEEELDGNPITAAWAKQGYRDTMGRVAIAENEARIMADMPKMREQSPEAYNDYLAERRAELMPQLEGMSLKQRASTFQNLLLNDRAAIKKHGSEHAKFQFEVEQRSIKSALTVKMAEMNRAAAENGQPTYQSASEALFATVNAAVIQNPKLNTMQAGGILNDILVSALDNDHQQFYQMVQEYKVPLPDGTEGPMASLISYDDAHKLNSQFRESVKRKEGQASFGYNIQRAQMTADFDNPDAPFPSSREVEDFLARGVRGASGEPWINPGDVVSVRKAWADAAAKRAKQAPGMLAWSSGNQSEMFRLNLTDEEGLGLWLADPKVRALPPAERVAQLATIGISQGRPAALKQLGKDLAPAVAQIMVGDNIDLGNMASLNSTLAIIGRAERNGQTGLLSTMMTAYPQETQDVLLAYGERLAQGDDTNSAINFTRTQLDQFRKLSPEVRAALSASSAKDTADIVKDFGTRDVVDSAKLYLKSIVSSKAATVLGTTPTAGWFEDESRLNEVVAATRRAAAEEGTAIDRTSPYLSKDAKERAIRTRVLARTVPTEQGNIILPRGVSLQSMFGVDGATGPERVGKAIDSIAAAGAGNRLVFNTSTTGQLTFTERGKDNELIRNGVIDPKVVQAKITETRNAEARDADRKLGRGITRGAYTYNGDNTAGMGNGTMYDLRTALIESGVYPQPTEAQAEDLTPTRRATLSAIFVKETDDAAKDARQALRETGRASTPLLAMLAELSITGGVPVKSQEYQQFLQALRGTNRDAMLKALGSTPAFKKASEQSQARYVGVINKLN